MGKGVLQHGRERLAGCRYHGGRDKSPSSTDGPRALVLVKRQRELAEVGTKYVMKMLFFFQEEKEQDIIFSNSFSFACYKDGTYMS